MMTSLAPSVRRTRGMSSGFGTFFVQVPTQMQIGLLAHILIIFVTAPLMRSLVGMWNRAGLASHLNLPRFGVSSSGFLRSSCGSGFLTSEGFLLNQEGLLGGGRQPPHHLHHRWHLLAWPEGHCELDKFNFPSSCFADQGEPQGLVHLRHGAADPHLRHRPRYILLQREGREEKRVNATFHVMLRWAGGIHSTSS